MKQILVISAAAMWLGAMCAPALAGELTILPGYWSSTNTSKLLTTQKSEDKRCISASQVNNFLTTPNHHYKCNYSTRTVENGHILLHGQCQDKHGMVVQLDASGDYSPEHFHLSAKVTLDGLPIGATASTDAHRISETCPAGAPGPRE